MREIFAVAPQLRLTKFIAAAVVGLVGVAAFVPSAVAEDAAEWKIIPGGPGTGCATDATPYEFYVHDGDARRIAVYLQGGGGCWNSKNCGLDGRSTFENAVDEKDRPWGPAGGTGIFDLSNSANPLRGYTIVMAPYCTADVHLGIGTVRYEAANGQHLDVNYRGAANAQSVMDYVTKHYSNPKLIFVSGSSAGAIPAPVYASQLARIYKSARVVQLGDGAGGYRSARVSALLDTWGATRALKQDPLYHDLDVQTANFEDLYVRAGTLKNVQLAQVNTNEDAIQIFFMGQLGHQVTKLAPLLSGDLAQIRERNGKFVSYTIPGAVHTILQRPEFYTTTVDNVALSKWVTDLLDGRRVQNVGDSLLAPGLERLK